MNINENKQLCEGLNQAPIDEPIHAEIVRQTLEATDIASMVVKMRDNHVKPRKVKTFKGAKRMTKSDPLGIEWRKGDEYYILKTSTEEFMVNLTCSDSLNHKQNLMKQKHKI